MTSEQQHLWNGMAGSGTIGSGLHPTLNDRLAEAGAEVPKLADISAAKQKARAACAAEVRNSLSIGCLTK